MSKNTKDAFYFQAKSNERVLEWVHFFNHTIDLSLTQCVTTRLLTVILSSLHKNFSRPTMMMVCTMCEIWFLMLRQEFFLAKEKKLILHFFCCARKNVACYIHYCKGVKVAKSRSKGYYGWYLKMKICVVWLYNILSIIKQNFLNCRSSSYL